MRFVALLLVAAVLPGWSTVRRGPAGGAVYSGAIPNQFAAWDHRPSAIYLPPHFAPSTRYPVVYLLPGMPGAPSSYWDSLRLAAVADHLIASGQARPFIAVMVEGGPRTHRKEGEWAGIWERYVVSDVVPWVDEHLPTIRTPQARAIEGLSAGGFGAVDIGLRHPGMFGTLGSWGGYFAPTFRDGPFAHATREFLAAHDPSLLVRSRAAVGVRFYLSIGGSHGGVPRRWTIQFAHELTTLHLPHELWLLPRAEQGHFWRATVESALEYAARGFNARATRA